MGRIRGGIGAPCLPNTETTSGNEARIRSCAVRSVVASVTEMPGRVVGMYRSVSSFRGA